MERKKKKNRRRIRNSKEDEKKEYGGIKRGGDLRSNTDTLGSLNTQEFVLPQSSLLCRYDLSPANSGPDQTTRPNLTFLDDLKMLLMLSGVAKLAIDH